MVNTIKKIVVFTVIGLTAVPASFASAMTFPCTSSDALIENVANAQSIDFNMDIDVEVGSNELEHPVSFHVDVNGVSDVDQNAKFDLGFWATGEHGEFSQTNGSIMKISDTLYFSENENDWYFVELNASDAPSSTQDETEIEQMKTVMQELFDRGVIEYKAETIDFINKKMTVRYAYTVNNDRFVDYVREKQGLSEEQSDAFRTWLANGVTIGGNFWVDTSEMLPVMITLNIDAFSSETSYTKIQTSILFNSFNDEALIEAPEHAMDMKEYEPNTSLDAATESLEDAVNTMDFDADGLTNHDEETIWYSNPMSQDTDADGYDDYTEVVNGYNPNAVGKLDSDGDGLTDYAEMTIHWTDRFDVDSDNDGYPDGVEIASGYNPNGPGRW